MSFDPSVPIPKFASLCGARADASCKRIYRSEPLHPRRPVGSSLLRRDTIDLTRTGLTEVTSAPLANGGNDGNETLPFASQAIVHLGRNDAVILSIKESCLRERLQFATQDSWSDLLRSIGPSQEAASDLTIAKRTVLEIPHDAELVFSTDHFLKCRDRATAWHR